MIVGDTPVTRETSGYMDSVDSICEGIGSDMPVANEKSGVVNNLDSTRNEIVGNVPATDECLRDINSP